jgi:2,4-dienoyl-CoA reductase-like NADH-dependent reductase (Old Yellow Enzyme family)
MVEINRHKRVFGLSYIAKYWRRSMSKLFEESTINGMTLRNRFVRAATWEGLATTAGEATPKLIGMMASLAQGGVGLIISSHSYLTIYVSIRDLKAPEYIG